MLGRQQPASCTLLQAVALEGPTWQFLVLFVPRVGEAGVRNLGWGRACQVEEGWLGSAPRALCLSSAFS